MDLSRQQFLHLIGAGIGALALAPLAACDDSGGTGPSDGPPVADGPKDAATDAPPTDGPPADAPMGNCAANGTMVAIGANHGHVLIIPKEDIVAGVEKNYTMTGGSHTHPVKITAAMFAMLQNNMTVQGELAPTEHPHPFTITCA